MKNEISWINVDPSTIVLKVDTGNAKLDLQVSLNYVAKITVTEDEQGVHYEWSIKQILKDGYLATGATKWLGTAKVTLEYMFRETVLAPVAETLETEWASGH